MAKSEYLSSTLMKIGLSIALLISGIQQVSAAPANNLTDRVAVTTEENYQAKSPLIWKIELPPLGDADKFLPPAKTAPVNPFQDIRLVLRLKERRVYIYRKDQLQTSFPVAVGKAGWETPTGNFKVIQMIENPSWQHPWTGEIVPPGPDNPLGSRWIGFWTDGKNVIGFHGTPNPESIGRPASHGCVRMYDRDVQALFKKVEVGTPVIVEP
jgi:lipoprotein-anchoring transpeptidase ErfK/SrfK